MTLGLKDLRFEASMLHDMVPAQLCHQLHKARSGASMTEGHWLALIEPPNGIGMIMMWYVMK